MANANDTGTSNSYLQLLTVPLTLVVALVAISLGYGFHYEFECRAVFPTLLCHGLSLGVPRALCAAALFALVLLVRPAIRVVFWHALRPRLAVGPFLTMLVGFGTIMLPLGYLMAFGTILSSAALIILWLGGAAMVAVGLFFALFNPSDFRTDDGFHALVVVIFALTVGFMVPEVALLFQWAWAIEALTDATFQSVQFILTSLGYDIVATSADKTIVVVDVFGVAVGRQCSGVEGFALTTVFTLAYIVLFRQEIWLRRAIFILPVALFLSWCLNAVRISGLIMLGVHVSPELAANGFHSHAGWLAFLLLAMLIAVIAHGIPWFRRHTKPVVGEVQTNTDAVSQTPFFADRVVVLILPFAVFMASSTFISAFFAVPGLYYPARILAVVAVLYLGRAVLRQLDWKVDPLAVAAGVGCGLLWLVTAPPPTETDTGLTDTLAALPSAVFLAWVVMRLVGTSVIVPVLEEFFFRGYLQARIAEATYPATRWWPWIGLAVSALCFGFLHDRFVAGVLAGLLFGALYYRHNRLSDAVYAHMAANFVIACAAVIDGSWHLI